MPSEDTVPAFDLAGLLRRIRRRGDLSQRELADRLGVSKSTVAAAESGERGLDARVLATSAALAGLRLALLDDDDREVRGMDPAAVRDRAGRRFPAHLDTVLSEERSWRWEHRPHRPRPIYTFDRRGTFEDPGARTVGRPDDHLLPRPGDTPRERAAARERDRRRRRQAEFLRRMEACEPRRDDGWSCTCPSVCDELDDGSGPPIHAENCPCRCDVG